jgi:(E)-4-hydroxy-3-methylbut-2-enyl-diphosphate synthase
VRDEREAAAAAQWVVDNEDMTAMTPERMAAMEAEAAAAQREAGAVSASKLQAADEDASPSAGRRFKRPSAA